MILAEGQQPRRLQRPSFRRTMRGEGAVAGGASLGLSEGADFVGNERILGRDVLNRVEVLFRGPAGEVVVNP
jgi:hypothetical protein